ncbi:MAG: Hsp70 family protein [Christensenellales bacterium]
MFIGIDLGTTNSAITSFDGKNTRVWKSPEQNDVTPSVIYIAKRGGRFYGKKAYDNAPLNPENTAQLFKRLMGSSTKIKVADIEMTPEECSAEILRTLFGYLPEDVRNDKKTGTVITVPAAFNQMQKNATKEAAFGAGINKVALIQEPVAAIMSVAKQQNINGLFVVYDFGGGTFDVSIAERAGNKINLLTNDGIAFCGGRDFDKLLLDNIVVPWLKNNFNLPDGFRINEKYAKLIRMATWATEQAKIELSAKETASVQLDESVIRCSDESGNEIYLDVPLSREQYNNLIFSKIDETIEKTREVISNVGLKPEDINYVVFVGGPTQYKPLRDRVSQQLGIAPSTDVNPMTAVSEGAAIYAESVDFETAKGGQKADKGIIKAQSFGLEFRYNARTSSDKAKIAVVFKNADKLNFVFKSQNTGWTSGKLTLSSGSIVTVDLTEMGENSFSVQCFDENGTEVKLPESNITIAKTLINIGKIPCAHSVGVELEDPVTGKPILDYLIKKDDLLPKSGTVKYKTTKRISAGSNDSISFKLWEGEIADPVEYNRFIGEISISGNSFEYGIIPVGSEILCDYTFSDSGNIETKVTVPSVGITETKDSYDRLSGQIDFNNDDTKIVSEAQSVLEKIEELSENIFDEKLDEAATKIRSYLDRSDDLDAEDLQTLFEITQTGKGVVASFMRENKAIVWQQDLDSAMDGFSDLESNATEAQKNMIYKLQDNIQRAIDANSPTAEKLLAQLHDAIAKVAFNNDDIFYAIFASMAQNPQEFTNQALFNQLVNQGCQCIQSKDINGLKSVLQRMIQIRIPQEGSDVDTMLKGSGLTK